MTQNQVDLSALYQGFTRGNKFSPHQHTQRQLGQNKKVLLEDAKGEMDGGAEAW